ncbi:TonB-dependent receptor [Pseudarcicella hirudinis]|uniref:TonB-dependent receptor n=1 Tax=Pseudarcicella hirudinis TaxID=1079859 RepID=A0A1I5T4K3_9BACT|nr:TonB-dependent receptor [Pseudarcicella hirudinis]SFP77984.1 TonB-dependent receptor [Pseudarcicella hirudinis]
MCQRILLFVILSFFSLQVLGGTLKGTVLDKQTGEPITGASVRLSKKGFYDVSGLDGTFSIKNVPAGVYQIHVSFVSFQTYTKEIVVGNKDLVLNIALEEDARQLLNEVVVSANVDKSTENAARQTERKANQLMNIVSGKAIELSPDLTVANLVQRVSGISIERNSNGDGQYAILRGMDKRYNYTLVNGIKIPSPDNKYRYVPLDIFPSELLGRLEVFKTLTPDMEGDAVGGVINMVMKDAPERLEVSANLATGYNQLFMDRDFVNFNTKDLNYKSPYEQYGNNYNATLKDFPKGAVQYTSKRPMLNLVGGFSVGNRFYHNKFGVILAGSFQNTYRGSNSLFYSSTVYDTEKSSRITSLAERQYSEQQSRLGLHAKMDFRLNENHKLQWYNAYMNLANEQLRDTKTTDFSSGGYDPVSGNAGLTYSTRSRLTVQKIFNSTLQGTHKLTDKFKMQWSAVYSSATNENPYNTSVSLLGKRVNFKETKTYPQESTRRWEHNSDRDLAGYVNGTYLTTLKNNLLEISFGGMYRDKSRDNFYNNYVLKPTNPFAEYGKDFTDYGDISWSVENPRGAVASALNYTASEKIGAGYGMAKWQKSNLQIIGGLRVEHTDQGYSMLFPLGELRPTGNQEYTDLLPSANAKYALMPNQNLRASYFRSINRPGFFELVPGKVVNEEYQERGNPDLKRAIADNFDIRYEYFPTASDQFMAGVFYKKIQNPIEYTLQLDETRGQDVFYTPGNFGDATNYGLELDAIKYFQKFGIKANYTYTNSEITTKKMIRVRNQSGNLEAQNVNQTRPMYGQSAHVGNVSLFYKNQKTGWDAQIAASYTGERINTVSQFLDNDLWQEAFIQMDASVERKFGKNWVIFAKANNLLNTPMRVFIKNTNPVNANIPQENASGNKTLIREDYYQRSYLIGIRYKL